MMMAGLGSLTQVTAPPPPSAALRIAKLSAAPRDGAGAAAFRGRSCHREHAYREDERDRSRQQQFGTVNPGPRINKVSCHREVRFFHVHSFLVSPRAAPLGAG